VTFEDITGAWDYSSLPGNVEVGSGCYLERKDSFARFRSERSPGIRIGDRVRVYTWTTFNVEPTGMVEIGDGSILVGAVFMCADAIVIGRRVVISYNVTIADSDFHPLDPDQRKSDAIANAPSGDRGSRPAIVSRPVVVEDDVWIGIGALVLKGVRIGKGARVAAGAVVTRDVPAGAHVEGNPARVILGRAARP
jgi:acetyltransferase-like isoleucine patch superfamily enzyme